MLLQERKTEYMYILFPLPGNPFRMSSRPLPCHHSITFHPCASEGNYSSHYARIGMGELKNWQCAISICVAYGEALTDAETHSKE